jgi:hypothetical protein
VDSDSLPRPSPVELVESVIARVTASDAPRLEPPGNDWYFACGVLFALGTTRQLDDGSIARFESQIQAEAQRLSGNP